MMFYSERTVAVYEQVKSILILIPVHLQMKRKTAELAIIDNIPNVMSPMIFFFFFLNFRNCNTAV